MPERILEMRVFEVRYQCDDEKDGRQCEGSMRFTGERLAQNLFKHICPACRAVKILPLTYPVPMGLPINEPIPEQWHDKLVREQVHNPPPEKSVIVKPN